MKWRKFSTTNTMRQSSTLNSFRKTTNCQSPWFIRLKKLYFHQIKIFISEIKTTSPHFSAFLFSFLSFFPPIETTNRFPLFTSTEINKKKRETQSLFSSYSCIENLPLMTCFFLGHDSLCVDDINNVLVNLEKVSNLSIQKFRDLLVSSKTSSFIKTYK